MLRIKPASLFSRSYTFREDLSHRQTCLIFWSKEGQPSRWSVDIGFSQGRFKGEEIAPSLCINPIETSKASAAQLAGESFSADTIEQCQEREDSFYIFEHEPMVCYTLKVLEVSDGKAHVTCSGTLVVDGYAEPYTTATFSIDSWIPVIESPDDWDKLGL
ncbi:MAG: hypothetical protein E7559_08520 [Ruminococcaceae bacterium]|nr:hypothetical protein [Oscillospiraceae bacterium]